MTKFQKPKVSLCLFFGLLILSGIQLRNIQFGQSNESPYYVYTIEIEHFGIDSKEMERSITIPLEQDLQKLPGILEISSVSEYSVSRITLFFSKKENEKLVYLHLRSVVDNFYEMLPNSVQKPRIYSATSSQKPTFVVSLKKDSMSLMQIRTYSDTQLRNRFESIDGVAQVVIAGGATEEVQIEVATEKLVTGGINPNTISTIIQDANTISNSGKVSAGKLDYPVTFNTRVLKLDDVKELPLPVENGIIPLHYRSSINIGPRSQDEILRLNGQETVTVSIMATGNSNAVKISRQCSQIIEDLKKQGYEVTILQDEGRKTEEMIVQVVKALLQSFLLIIIILPFFIESAATIALLVSVLPLTMVCTLAILATKEIVIDQNILTGLTISFGLIIDAGLVISELAQATTQRQDLLSKVSKLFPAIIASTVTSIASLIPLWFLEYMVPGVRTIVITIIMMLAVSLVITYLFIPVWMPLSSSNEKAPSRHQRLVAWIERKYVRLHSRYYKYSKGKTKRPVVVFFVVISLLTIGTLYFTGKNVSVNQENELLYFYVEFDADTSSSYIDTICTDFISDMQKTNGIVYVKTEAKKGVLEGVCRFDKKIIKRNNLAASIAQKGKLLPQGFLYVPDLSDQNDLELQEIQIAILGDENSVCQELAEQAGKIISTSYNVEQVVMNFKEPEKVLVFKPGYENLIRNNLSVAAVANTLRMLLFGAVVDKWLQDGSEMDIRLSGSEAKTTDIVKARHQIIPSATGSISLENLGSFTLGPSEGKIYRKNGRRAAYLTVHIHAKNTDAALKRPCKKNCVNG